MADRELIAAKLTAGMLPTVEIPRSRAQGQRGPLTRAEGEAIQRAVDHALGLYRLVLNGLGVDPFASEAGPGAQPRPPAAMARDKMNGRLGHDAPRSGEPASQPSRALVADAPDPRERGGNGAIR
jgi:hypothetical protein